MKNKEVKGILALVVVTALSFGVIAGSRALSTDIAGSTGAGETAAVVEEYDVSGSETVEKAVRTESGYEVTVRESGYASDIVMRVAFESDASTISSVEVLEQNETESLGSRIAEPEFLDQFKGVSAPVYLPGMTLDDAGSAENAASETEGAASQESLETLEGAALSDGTYTASGQPDSNGYTDQVSITVENGAITAVTWDAVMEDGTSKSVLSENGEYTMTEDGLTWKEQHDGRRAHLERAVGSSLLGSDRESVPFLPESQRRRQDRCRIRRQHLRERIHEPGAAVSGAGSGHRTAGRGASSLRWNLHRFRPAGFQRLYRSGVHHGGKRRCHCCDLGRRNGRRHQQKRSL